MSAGKEFFVKSSTEFLPELYETAKTLARSRSQKGVVVHIGRKYTVKFLGGEKIQVTVKGKKSKTFTVPYSHFLKGGGNKKLAKNVMVFSLTPGVSNSNNVYKRPGTCLFKCQGCYAYQGAFVWKNAVALRNNITSLIEEGHIPLVEFMVAFIIEKARKNNAKRVIVRVHDTGDFVTRNYMAYIAMWGRIARAFPDVRFYAYTKADKRAMEFLNVDSALNNYFTSNGIGAPTLIESRSSTRKNIALHVASALEILRKRVPNFNIIPSFILVRIGREVYPVPNFGTPKYFKWIAEHAAEPIAVCPDTIHDVLTKSSKEDKELMKEGLDILIRRGLLIFPNARSVKGVEGITKQLKGKAPQGRICGWTCLYCSANPQANYHGIFFFVHGEGKAALKKKEKKSAPQKRKKGRR